MISTIQGWTIIGLASAIWLALLLPGIATGGPSTIADIANIVPVIFGGMYLFERWIWRLGWLHPHVVSQPVLHGTWKGELRSMWGADPATGALRAPKTVYLVVSQRLASVQVRLLTDESASGSLAGLVTRQPNGEWVLSYSYDAVPKLTHRDGNPQHRGAVLLTAHNEPVTRLEGEYWTARESRGVLEFTERVSETASGYPDAVSLFEDD